jgi:hypothetical protein
MCQAGTKRPDRMRVYLIVSSRCVPASAQVSYLTLTKNRRSPNITVLLTFTRALACPIQLAWSTQPAPAGERIHKSLL